MPPHKRIGQTLPKYEAVIAMDDMDHENDEGEEIWLSKKKNYTILNQEEVVKLQEDDIERLSAVFALSKSDACLLLLRSNLRTFDLADAWFDDETKNRENTGLLKKPILDNTSEDPSTSCRLCSSDSNSSNISAASCGHPFCGDCWRGYIRKSINEEGGACLMLRCPEPDCSAAVGPALVQNATNQEAACYEKYKKYQLRSYVFQNHDLIKWCPAPDCNRAIRLDAGSNSSTTCNYVSCDCSRSYCWNCEEEEDHRPVDCETAGKWRREKPAEGNKYYDRYKKYYRRWQESGESEKKALEVFDEAKQRHDGLDLLLEACKQMIECRQASRWTVVYGYYNMRDVEEQHPKHNLFECLQDHAKVCLERLESQVEQFLISAKLNDPSSASVVESNEFARVRVRLQDLTITTMTCFKNLVRTLEEGFPELSCRDDDVEASWTCDRCTYVNAMSAVNCEICGTADTAEGECGGYWSCDRCTYLNPASTLTCSLCSS